MMEILRTSQDKSKKFNKENGYYTLETETKTSFNDAIMLDDFIIAFSKEKDRDEGERIYVKVYNKELNAVLEKSYYSFSCNDVQMEKYQFKNVFLLQINDDIIVICKGKCKCITIDGRGTRSARRIYKVHRNIYIIHCIYKGYVENFGTYTKDKFYKLNIDTDEVKEEKFSRSEGWNYDSRENPRFMFYPFIGGRTTLYDIYTGFYYEVPEYITNIKKIKVYYSSKEIIILRELLYGTFHLYINGHHIYKYKDGEEHKEMLFNLRENLVISKEFKALPIGDNLYIWIKKGKPEVINLNFKKK